MKYTLLMFICAITATHTLANATTPNSGWFVKPAIGISQLSDQDATATATGNLDGNWQVETSSGFQAGLGLGYRYNAQLAVELYWEYRSNDTDTTVYTTGDIFEGNYASNLFYLNGYYYFDHRGDWHTYAGAGIGWTQEIDIDLEQGSLERSYSGDGDVSYQLMLGTDYQIAQDWQFNAELRYSIMSSVDLQGEENAVGEVRGLDYNPVTLSLAIKYRF